MLRAAAVLFIACISLAARAQGFPWERPLLISWSADGTAFAPPTVFQDSSGVPCVVRWRGDTLVAAFQWFRQPNPSPTWDRVAVKFSYDNGANWTAPTPIVVNGMPPGFQRPFDPTLATFHGDSLRMFFSSSEGMPIGLDSTVNTYSARSADGIHYFFEPGPRVDLLHDRVIDPAVAFHGSLWHYLAPAGAPQDGAHHFISQDGLLFDPQPPVPSDAMHNWTGNLEVESANFLRFYGSGPNGIWHNTLVNGSVWSGYVNTNLQGGDPSVLKVAEGSYLIVYVGAPYSTSAGELLRTEDRIIVLPQPGSSVVRVRWPGHVLRRYQLWSMQGALVATGTFTSDLLAVEDLRRGHYVLQVEDVQGIRRQVRVVKD